MSVDRARDDRRPIVLATRSAGKLRELRALCAEAGFASESLTDCGIVEDATEDTIEVYETFAENAEAKARYFAALLPGRVLLAEDSGLVVDALGGAPGVQSKRWSGSAARGAALDAANNAALRRALEESSEGNRAARYVCVAVCLSGADLWRAEGRVEGAIARAPSGDGGFGYDPWFVSAELGTTFGDATPEAKARVSHRARAVRGVFAACGEVLRHRVRGVS